MCKNASKSSVMTYFIIWFRPSASDDSFDEWEYARYGSYGAVVSKAKDLVSCGYQVRVYERSVSVRSIELDFIDP